MPAPVYDDGDFLGALQALLPRGPIWPRDQDAVQTQTLRSLAPTFTRLVARAAHLLDDAFPVQPVELLPEWEATLGLPDPCAGPSPTLQVRQQQVAARFAAGGGQSIPYITQFAASLGYAITITEFTTWKFGMAFGQPLQAEAWAHAWQVNAPGFTLRQFSFGRDAFGDPFAAWDNNVLQCELQRIAPAHTMVIFSYGGAVPISLVPAPAYDPFSDDFSDDFGAGAS